MNYLDKLKHLTQRPADNHALQAGDLIEWDRAGTMQTGIVDFLYTDDSATRWAFVTIGETWAAVNLKFAKRAGHE